MVYATPARPARIAFQQDNQSIGISRGPFSSGSAIPSPAVAAVNTPTP